MDKEAVLISIQPKWCELIANRKKTVEVRKTKPKLKPPFKCYIYCTKAKPYLVIGDVFRGDWHTEHTLLRGYGRKEAEEKWTIFNGGVIGEFICDRIDAIDIIDSITMTYIRVNNQRPNMCVTNETCLNVNQLQHYLGDKRGYGWHISNLKIYDESYTLSDFVGLRETRFGEPVEIVRPPQSWCYIMERRADNG